MSFSSFSHFSQKKSNEVLTTLDLTKLTEFISKQDQVFKRPHHILSQGLSDLLLQEVNKAILDFTRIKNILVAAYFVMSV